MPTNQKQFKTYEEQIKLLTDRGMIVTHPEEAKVTLARINYYRLSGYWFPYFDKKHNRFTPDLTFDKIVALYNYDSKLRHCLLDALSEVEITFRALLGYELGKHHPLCYRDSNKMGKIAQKDGTHSKQYQDWLVRFQEVKEKSKEEFVIHHNACYQGEMPIWVAVEIMDWGLLSRLYSLSPSAVQQNIASRCALTQPQVASWLKSLNIARNMAAHHSRMYNRAFSILPKLPKNACWEPIRAVTNRVFTIIVMLIYLHKQFHISDGLFLHEIIKGFPGDPEKRQKALGVPENWESIIETITHEIS